MKVTSNYRGKRVVLLVLLQLAALVLIASRERAIVVYADPPPDAVTQLLPPDPAPNLEEASSGPLATTGGATVPPGPIAPLTVVGGTWLSQGPGASINGQVEGIVGGGVSGAIHTVAAHPSNADILYVGAVNGGIWRTNNATAANPSWTPLTDDQASLSIGALEFDPTDVTSNTLVAGIGRYSSFSSQGGARTGLLRTTDGGATWTALSGGGTLSGANISGVAPRGSTIAVSVNVADSFFCSNIGVFQSTDGGSSFTQTMAGVSFDLAGDPLNNNVLYSSVTFGPACGFGPNGVYKSTDTGATWIKVSNAAMDALIVDNTTNNLELAARGNNVFANIIQSGQSAGIFASGDGGGTWTQMDLPLLPVGPAPAIAGLTPGAPIVVNTSAAHGLSSGDEVQVTNVTQPAGANGIHTITVVLTNTFQLNGTSDATAWTGDGNWQKLVGMNPRVKPGGQGGIHASIVVHPITPTLVYVGGDRQDLPFPNFIGALNYTGSLFRGDAALAAAASAPSPQWDHLTHSPTVTAIPNGGTASTSAPHADSREMVFDANGDLIEVDDGGVYRRTAPGNNSGDWFSINGNIRVTEMHDVAYDNLSNTIISGNQDTGTTYQPAVGADVWTSLSTADGGDVAVDNLILAGSNQSVRYSSFQGLQVFRRTVWDAGGTQQSTTFPTLFSSGAGITAQFVTPVVTNHVAGGRLLFGGANGIYESTDEGANITPIAPLVTVNSAGHSIDYGGRRLSVDNPDVFYAVSGTTVHVRTASGGPITATAIVLTGIDTLTGVVMDPDDWRIAYAIDSDQVFRTIDTGATWTDITGGAPFDTNLRSIAAAPGELFVGGGLGVYTMDMSAPGTWNAYGSGLPHAPVWDLAYDDTDKVLVAGTLGRGAWLMPVTAVGQPLVYAAPSLAACGSNAPCLAGGDALADALLAVADNGTVQVIGTHTITAPLTNGVGKSVILEGPTGTVAGTLNITGTGFAVSSGSLTIRGLNLSGATTLFDVSGGALTAYANNITGWTTPLSFAGGSVDLGNNWWGGTSGTYNAADPGLPTGDWAKRLGADIGAWARGTGSAALGNAGLSGGSGTAVILSYGRDAANAPFGNGIAPHVDDMCSDYYDFFVRGAGTWSVTVPVDDNSSCNTNTRDADRLYYIPDVANCAPTNPACWTGTGLTVGHGANDLVATGLTPPELDGTHFVAGDSQGLDPTAITWSAAQIGNPAPLSGGLLLSLALALLATVGVATGRYRRRQARDHGPR